MLLSLGKYCESRERYERHKEREERISDEGMKGPFHW
jgi:hypothetical protein